MPKKLDLLVAGFVKICLGNGFRSPPIAAALVRGAAHMFHVEGTSNEEDFIEGCRAAFRATATKKKDMP